MLRTLLCSALALSLSIFFFPFLANAGGPGAATGPIDGTSIDSVAAQYYSAILDLNPTLGTSLGLKGYNAKFTNEGTKEYRGRVTTLCTTTLAQLHAIDTSRLSHDQWLTYQVMRFTLNERLEGLRFPGYMLPMHQMRNLPSMYAQWGSGTNAQPFKTVQDYKDWIMRLSNLPAWADTAMGNMRLGMKEKVVLPKALVVKLIPQMESFATPLEKSLFYQPITGMPASFTTEEKAALTALYIKTINDAVLPTYAKLATFFKDEYLPAARTTTGWRDLPNGEAWYRYQVRSNTTTNLSPDSIFKIGQAEVTRLEKEIMVVKNRMGFSGSLKEFFVYLTTDKKFKPYTDAAQVLAAFEQIHQRVDASVGKLFSLTPKTPFVIRQTEAFRAKTSAAEYVRGSLDGTRPGIFYVPILDAKTFTTSSGMESLFIHEAIPGHHYQLSLMAENTTLPAIRRTGGQTAFTEGWALYCESLGKELNMYQDDVQYIGALGDEMHRAIRLVVDVGMHHKGMSREQAIDYMMAHEQLDLDGITKEIERYMAMPGQALAYKIGALKIRELRTRLEKKQGAKFDIKAFHTAILAPGSLPLSVLETNLMQTMR